MNITPIDLLKEKLLEWERALYHLKDSFSKEEIPQNIYEERKENLEPKIQEYKDAINCLKIFGK